MAIEGIYDTGTISVNAGATAVTGVGTAWATVGITPGDKFEAGGLIGIIESSTDNTHLTLTRGWPGASNLSGAGYQIIEDSWLRSAISTTQRQIGRIVNILNGTGYIYPVAAGGTPDNSLGEDGQYAQDFENGKWWKKAAGVWGNPYKVNYVAAGTTTAGRIPRFTDANGTIGQSAASIDGSGNLSGILSLLLSPDTDTELRTYTNNDHGVFHYYQAQNHWTTNQYYRVLDIVSAGGNTKSVIRFLNQLSTDAAPVETMYIEDTGTIYARYNLSVAGTMSAGSKAFLIDHPLDPLNKDLKHGLVEAPRYDLLYRGRVTLANGQATVDIDAASRMTAGTFAALTQNADVVSLCNRSGFSRVRATEITGGTFTILCEDANSADEIAWVVLAERHDPFIINSDGSWTDQDGRLIPERDKPDYQEA